MLAVKKCCSTSKCSTSTGYYLLRCKDCSFPALMTHPYILPDNRKAYFHRYLNCYELQIGCYHVAILLNSSWFTSFYGIHENFVKFTRISWNSREFRERGQSHETYDPVVRLMVQSWDSRYKIGLNNYLLTVPVFPYMITYFSKKYFDKFFLRKNVHTPLLYLSPIKWNVL